MPHPTCKATDHTGNRTVRRNDSLLVTRNGTIRAICLGCASALYSDSRKDPEVQVIDGWSIPELRGKFEKAMIEFAKRVEVAEQAQARLAKPTYQFEPKTEPDHHVPPETAAEQARFYQYAATGQWVELEHPMPIRGFAERERLAQEAWDATYNASDVHPHRPMEHAYRAGYHQALIDLDRAATKGSDDA